MYVIVFANLKGGAGKTTLTSHLGVQAHLAKAGPVALMDFDTEQQSLTEWWRERPEDGVHMAQCPVKELPTKLESLKHQGIKLAFIDTPPQVGTTVRRIVECADLVVVPCKASPNDLRAVGKTVALLEALGKKLVFVVNEATPRARLTGSAAIELSQHGTVSPVIVPKRESYRLAMVDGHATQEVDAAAAEEMDKLWGYLAAILKKGGKR